MRYVLSVTFILLLFTGPCSAQQKGFQAGYIVTQAKDTLKGWVKDRDNGTFQRLYQKIRFLREGKRRPKKFSANEIIGYSYENTVFEAVPVVETSVFLVRRYQIVPGSDRIFLKVIDRNNSITYYRQEFVWEDNDFIDDFPLFHRHDKQEMVRVNQGILGLKKKRLAEYFQDCPELVELINQERITSVREVYDYFSSSCTKR